MSFRMVFGKPGLANSWCESCRKETLHRYCRCIHCGAIQSALVPRLSDYGYEPMAERRKSGGRHGKLNPRRAKLEPC